MKREFLVDFGNVVLSQRKRLEISQEELGFRAGLHRTYVTEIEAGVRNISIDSILRLAKGLEISLTQLFERFEKGAKDEAILPIKKSNGTAKPVDILLVEDDSKHVALTLDALRANGITNSISVVNSGEEAVEFLFSRRSFRQLPKLILLDLELPKLSGVNVLQRIRSEKETSTIPVIILTASRSDQDYNEAMKLGVSAYIVKPVDFTEFSAVVPKVGLGWQLVEQKKLSLIKVAEGLREI